MRPPARQLGRVARACWAGVLIALVGCGAVVLHRFDPTKVRFYPPCVFYKLTHCYCPGCGSTRALHALVHFHPAEAFRFNPLMVVSLPFLAVLTISRFTAPRKGKWPLALRLKPWVLQGIFVLVVAYWVLRNVPVKPFSYLAPGGW